MIYQPPQVEKNILLAYLKFQRDKGCKAKVLQYFCALIFPAMPQLIPLPKKRQFLPADLQLHRWDELEPFFMDLEQRELHDIAALERWMADRSELEAFLDEDLAWRYIHMTCDTENTEKREAYELFIRDIFPAAAPYDDRLNRKLLAASNLSSVNYPGFGLYLKRVQSAVALYREENVSLQAQQKQLESEYGAVVGAMTIRWEGQEYTLPQAAQLLKSDNRAQREAVYHLMAERRRADQARLDDLLTKLIALRTQIAKNAGFANYRDYRFAELNRFDYTAQDCFDFHEAIRLGVVPIKAAFDAHKKQELGLAQLRPWDLDAEPQGRAPLKPFTDQRDLIHKSIAAFSAIDPYFGDCLYTMDQLGHFDLESRKGKAPGGYNYPLMETGAPFIFMNAASSMSDLETMMHEGGHAIHSFLSKDLPLRAFKELPSEVAELASMSMELISMDQYPQFFGSAEELRRARYEQLQRALSVLPWIANVDAFQHWLYLNPNHTVAERHAEWARLFKAYGSPEVDWSGLEANIGLRWQSQLHIFEVPFYYIEYGFAQLGALAVWKKYTENPAQALGDYKKALALGYTASIPEVYAAAGIAFDFRSDYLKTLLEFTQNEINKVLRS
jgi:oligoendopeptidase F